MKNAMSIKIMFIATEKVIHLRKQELELIVRPALETNSPVGMDKREQ